MLLALFSSIITFADVPKELFCNQINPSPDHAFSAIVRRLEEAQISESTLAGPRVLARLRCGSTNPGRPDRPVITTCQNSRFAGYVLTVRTGGFLRNSARLEQRLRGGGTRLLASMSCRGQ